MTTQEFDEVEDEGLYSGVHYTVHCDTKKGENVRRGPSVDTNMNSTLIIPQDASNIYFAESKDLFHIPRNSNRMRNFNTTMEHLEEFLKFGISYNREGSVMA